MSLKFYIINPESNVKDINKIEDKINLLKTYQSDFTIDIVNENRAPIHDRIRKYILSDDRFNLVSKLTGGVNLLNYEHCDRIDIPMKSGFTYKTEIVLLTKTFYELDLITWLNYHLKIAKVDHIIVLDNESPVNVKSICEEYSQVEYHLIKGWADQYKLYDNYVNSSSAKYCIPIDDDEYIFVNKWNGELYPALEHYLERNSEFNKLSIEWLNLFPRTRIKSRTQAIPYIADAYCHRAVKHWQLGDSQVKTAVDCKYKYEYIGIKLGHNPKCLNGSSKAITVKGEVIKGQTMKECSDPTDDVILIHYQFRSEEEWIRKCKLGSPGSKWFSKVKNQATIKVLDKIYEFKNEFRTFTKLKDRLNELNRE